LRNSLILLALAAAPTAAFAQAAPKPAPATTPAPAAKAAAKPGDHAVGEVVVTGQAPTLQTSIDRRSYDVGKDLQAQTGSIGDALRNVPSVEVDVQGNVSLRGDPNVTILIDGKPSGMFEGDNKAQSLQALPANQIERVEVITNPSAEFRADGTGGVINLITKKAKGAGRTGSAKLTAGSAGRVFGSATAGYNSPKLSVVGDLNIRHDNQKQPSVEDRQRFDPATGGFDSSRQVQDLHSTYDIDSVRGAIDYDLDAKTRLSAELRGNYVDFTVGGPSRFEQTSSTGALTSAFQRDLDLHQLRSNGVATATLKRKFAEPGHEATLSLTYDATNDDRVRAGHTATLAPPVPESFDRQVLDYGYERTELKGDYVRPMGPGVTLKAGFDLQFDDNSYGNTGFRGPSKAALAPDPTLSNLFLFKQSLSQAYVTYEQPFGDLTVLAGLRIEDVRIDLDQVTQGRKDENDYTRAYPSLHLAWKLGDSQQLTASYSHRVQRPNPLQFNTFRLLIDPLNFRAGNAQLKPQETHSYELGYEYRASPTVYLATLYYRDNFNGFADVVRDLGNGVFLTTAENVSQSRSAGLELVTNGRLTKTLSYNVSTNLYWTEIAPQPLGTPESRSAVSASGRANLTWQATPKDLVQLNGFLNGKQLTPQGYFEPLGGLNLGYRHKFNDQLAFVLTVQDLLHTFKLRQVIDTPVLKSRYQGEFDSRQVQAGFTWTFGGGRAKDPGFEFQNGGGAPPP
jgi:outer membrane receptor protein involved in Fe transport